LALAGAAMPARTESASTAVSMVILMISLLEMSISADVV
jgi:hypothetical protein